MRKNISVDELKQKIDSGRKFILLDVRTEKEYNEGHIQNSILIPYDELNERHNELNPNKSDEIVAYCKTKNRSRKAAKILISLGYENVVFVLGGITAWIENGYRVSK